MNYVAILFNNSKEVDVYMFSIYDNIKRVESMAEFKRMIRPLYVIDEYAVSTERYEAFKDEITKLVIGSFHDGRMVTHPIKFKFYKDDKKTHQLQLRNFLYNIYLWQSMVELRGLNIYDETYILVPEKIKDVNDEIFRITLEPMIENSVDMETVQEYAANTVYDISSISVHFALIMALHFSDATVFYMYDNYGDLLKPKDYSNMQPDEIEQANIESEKELVDRIMNDPENPIHQIFHGGNPLKIKQLRELLMTVSLRPTLDGNVVTKPINKGLIMGALENPSDIYTDALAARLPMLVNNKDIGTVGYFIKALNILARTLEISNDVLDCGTTHYVNYEVKSSKHLKLLSGKYRVDDDELYMVKETDTHLIGKKIKVRSAITCCCGENEVCATCVGNLVALNWDISEGFATFVTEEWSKIVEQSKLSTKHLIHPIPEVITFSDSFYKWFILRSDEIYLRSDVTKKDYIIYIEPEEILKIEEFDADSTYNNFIDTGRFYIENTRTQDRVEISIKNNKKIYIRTEISEIMKDGKVPLKDLSDEYPIFEISIENNDSTKPFTELMNIVDLENKGLDDDSIDGISQRFLDLFVEGNIKLNIAGGEVILNRICRKPGKVQERPNFAKRKMPAYHFYSLGKCIEENASAPLGMIYEQLQRQLLRLNLEERNATSFIDPFFEEYVSMAPLLAQQEDGEDE